MRHSRPKLSKNLDKTLEPPESRSEPGAAVTPFVAAQIPGDAEGRRGLLVHQLARQSGGAQPRQPTPQPSSVRHIIPGGDEFGRRVHFQLILASRTKRDWGPRPFYSTQEKLPLTVLKLQTVATWFYKKQQALEGSTSDSYRRPFPDNLSRPA